MDYKEKYNQALNRAKEKYSACSAPALLEYIFPELKESEEENVRKVLVGYFKSYKEIGTIGAETFNGIPTDNIIAWLEKQGEQKPYGQRKECEDCQFNYAGECKGYCALKRNEHKPTDEVKPKFKVGDWIVLPLGVVAHIDSINSTDYQVTTTDGKICDFKISKQDNYRLWSINDAYTLADSKKKIIYKQDVWQTPPSPRQEMI